MNASSSCMVWPVVCIMALFCACSAEAGREHSAAQELTSIELPSPQTDTGRPLMQVLQDRKSTRVFSSDELPLQVLSNLLWAAFGINRPEEAKRTAPSAIDRREIDIYVAAADALYIYDPQAHRLLPVLAEDLREDTGLQPFVKDAPINLIYVADYSRMTGGNKEFYAAADTGVISQNVYLYCASEGLATVVRGLINRPQLAAKMRLRPTQRITLAQSVGYPGVAE